MGISPSDIEENLANFDVLIPKNWYSASEIAQHPWSGRHQVQIDDPRSYFKLLVLAAKNIYLDSENSFEIMNTQSLRTQNLRVPTHRF